MARSKRKDGSSAARQPKPTPAPPASDPPALDPPASAPPVSAPPAAAIGRVYGAVFGRVWIAALAAVRGMGRWTASSTDPVRGEILVDVRALLGSGTRRARVRIALDEVGLTRVDAAFFTDAGERAEEVGQRQVAGFYRNLEAVLRRDGR
jgi:hypothetical protein